MSTVATAPSLRGEPMKATTLPTIAANRGVLLTLGLLDRLALRARDLRVNKAIVAKPIGRLDSSLSCAPL